MRTPRRHFIFQALGSVVALACTRLSHALELAPPRPFCALTAEQEEGPFYIEDEALRSNLIEDRVGVPLILRVQLLDSKRCAPLKNAMMEIWSCDALGEYSGFSGMPSGGPPHGPRPHAMPPDGMEPHEPPPHHAPSNKKTFLRGMQRADAHGQLTFTTLYPGCYEGRVNHIHVKVRIADATEKVCRIVHTGQLFLPEQITKAVVAQKPYSDHRIKRTTLEEDHVFSRQHGDLVMASLTPIEQDSIAAGYSAKITFVVNPEAAPMI
jgi:protocatechuate 3,4-dioxygenase beta subunit